MTTLAMAELNHVFLALTPVERWEAARGFNSSFLVTHWLVLTMVAVLIILIATLFWVSYARIAQQRRDAARLFREQADRKGLSPREHEILRDIADRCNLRRFDAIFTMEEAFDRGAEELIEESLSTPQDVEATEQLKLELFFLYEKLGFKSPRAIPSSRASRKPGTRQIPVGKKLHVTRRKGSKTANIEGTVIGNDESKLSLQLGVPVQGKPGERWQARYYYGASVWEFDASMLRCQGKVLVLNHSDHIRFVNRRRFLRVPVNKPAYIASFPFAVTVPARVGSTSTRSASRQPSSGGEPTSWGCPQFVPAALTELAGPGLRLEAPLKLHIGERVLVVANLGAEQDANSQKTKTAEPAKIIEDIGVVRHIRTKEHGFSIAVELVGLSDADVNELICATNAACSKTAAKHNDTATDAYERQPEELNAAEPEVTQSV
jgi:hypothetical protein